MKNLFKKNQLMITALAVMLAIAGYLQFSGKNPEVKESVKEVSSDQVINQQEVNNAEIHEEEILSGIDFLDAGDELEADAALNGLENLYFEEVLDAIPDQGDVPGDTLFTAANGVMVLADAKLLKEQVRAKNKDMLMEIVQNESLGTEEKQLAVSSMVALAEYAEKEAEAEILLEAKGFEGAVVSVNSGSVDVVVNALELSDAQRAQIEDIVIRKTGIGGENIVISTLVP